MSKRGENIYKRKDARWEGRYIKGHDPQGKIQYGYVYAPSYREAKEKLLAAKLSAEKPPAEKPPLFSQCAQEWLLLRRNQVKESTYIKYRTVIERHLLPSFGGCLPHRITSLDAEAFSCRLLEQGLASKTVKDILMVLRSILDYVRKTSGSTLPEIQVTYPKDERKKMRVLSPEEQTVLITFLYSDINACKGGILLAMLTGLRIGELCALRWQDISFADNTLTVSQTMQRLQKIAPDGKNKTDILISEPKSRTSERVIPLSSQAQQLCRQMAGDPQAYVLTGKVDVFMEPRALQYRLGNYVKTCGLQGVHFHTLRHTFATRCVEAGFDIKSLSEILGHATVTMTLERYVHPSMDLKRSNMEKLAAVGM